MVDIYNVRIGPLVPPSPPMEDLRRGHDRYEKLRKLSASELQSIIDRVKKGEAYFDDLVDQLESDYAHP